MKLPYYHVDAFTSHIFGGNPAGVCIMSEFPPDGVLQKIAAEHNLSETAYCTPHPNGYELRWFTPAVEVDLCGHATLATAHIYFDHLGYTGNQLRFQSKSGELSVSKKA